ncbi:MAG: hypothetical protein ACRDPD_12795, partial [Streptosporangiaceae bacterium]
TAARIHALPALYLAAAADLPTLADPGYDGAGIGILIPVKQNERPTPFPPGPLGCRVLQDGLPAVSGADPPDPRTQPTVVRQLVNRQSIGINLQTVQALAHRRCHADRLAQPTPTRNSVRQEHAIYTGSLQEPVRQPDGKPRNA